MLQQQRQVSTRSHGVLTISLARDAQEVHEAQRLRFKVFAEEMGARVPGAEFGVDRDRYDAYCDHLIVRDACADKVVGTYRMLTGAQSRYAGGFYSENEFDLARLEHLRVNTVEVGRSCVHRDYRSGAVIAMLWAGLTRYAAQRGYGYLIGCASIGMADGGAAATHAYQTLCHSNLSPAEYRVFPRHEMPLRHESADRNRALPPLLKGYVRLGAWVCGAPAWDPDFNTADLLVLMPLARMNARYKKHLLSGRKTAL